MTDHRPINDSFLTISPSYLHDFAFQELCLQEQSEASAVVMMSQRILD